MLEICFNNSLKGCLMCAKERRGGRVVVASVIGFKEGENPPTEEEIEAHKRRVQTEHEKAMEEMIPLGGKAWQVFAYDFALCCGDIRDIPLNEEWDGMCSLVKDGEELRIWYDPRNPGEVCGLYWFLWNLKQQNLSPKLWLMALPEYFTEPDGTITVCRGWSQILPEKIGRYLYLQQEVSVGFFTMACSTWEKLREENAALRAIVNGKICSVPEDFYDGIIRMELNKQPEEFKEAAFIGDLIIRTCFGAMGDEFIHQRMMKMVADGILAVTTPSEDGSYRGQILRKN